MLEASYRIAVAAEDRGHFRAATHLADRVLRERVPWCVDILDDLRRWGNESDARPWAPLSKAYERARARGLRPWGHFDGEPGLADASMARAQILLFQDEHAEGATIDAVLLVRDTDDDPERARGFAQALRQPWPFPVVAALCTPEVEAWHVAGFDPETPAEHQRLTDTREALGFSPPREPHRLSSKRPQDPRDAKALLSRLCAGDLDRAVRCLDAPLDLLKTRGQLCGIVDYLADVAREFVPLLEGRAAAER